MNISVFLWYSFQFGGCGNSIINVELSLMESNAYEYRKYEVSQVYELAIIQEGGEAARGHAILRLRSLRLIMLLRLLR